MRWLDLAPYGLTLKVLRLPGRQPIPMMVGDTETHKDTLKGLGFVTAPNGQQVLLTRLELQAFHAAFPQAGILELTPEELMQRFGESLPAARPATPAAPPAQERPAASAPIPVAPAPAPAPAQAPEPHSAPEPAMAEQPIETTIQTPNPAPEAVLPAEEEPVLAAEADKATPGRPALRLQEEDPTFGATMLGLNRMAQEVWQKQDGTRFIRPPLKGGKYGAPVFETAGGNINPGSFLRAGANGEHLMAVAEGLVATAAAGTTIRYSDFQAFVSAAYGTPDSEDMPATDPRLGAFALAVEVAMTRHIHRAPANTMRDSFQAAMRLSERMAYGQALHRVFEEADIELPKTVSQPLSVAVQRIVGLEDEIRGRQVRIQGSGAGAFFGQLARSALVRVSEPSTALARYTQAAVNGTGRGQESYLDSQQERSGIGNGEDISVANLYHGLLDEPADIDGLKLGRADLAQAAQSLLPGQRSDAGRSVFLLRRGRSPEDIQEFELFRRWVACRFAIEGTSRISASLAGGEDNEPTYGLVVGQRRPEVLAEEDLNPEWLEVRKVDTFDEMWSWTGKVVADRGLIAEYYAKQGLVDEDAPEADGEETRKVNRFQAPYVSASKLGQASAMVPRNLDGATRHALERLKDRHPELDAWVAEKLCKTVTELNNILSPEQIDGVALAIDSHERDGRGFLFGDMTGIGKGRQLACVILWAVLNGKKVLFNTERAINLPDIVRDLRDVGAWEHCSTMVMNDANIIDERTGDILMQPTPRAEVDEICRARVWPEQYNLILATYSQFNKPGVEQKKRSKKKVSDEERRQRANAFEAAQAAALAAEAGEPAIEQAPEILIEAEEPEADAENQAVPDELQDGEAVEEQIPGLPPIPEGVSIKSLWLRQAVNEDVLVMMDESHNAASNDSNIGSNYEAAQDQAWNVIYSSATWAKGAKNMAVYGRLFPREFPRKDLTDIINRGGEDMQETVSVMLVKDGQMVVRQHDLSKCDFRVKFDDEHRDRNLAFMAKLAPVLSQMAFLSGDIEKQIGLINANVYAGMMQRHRGDENKARRAMKSLQLSKTSFGSPLFNLTRLFTTSLLVDQTVQDAVQALEEGQAPVISLDNTIQAVMRDLLERQEQGGFEARAPDFKDLMHRALGQLTRVTKSAKKGVKEVDGLFDATPQQEVEDELVSRFQQLLPPELLAQGGLVDGNAKETAMASFEMAMDMMRANLPPEEPQAEVILEPGEEAPERKPTQAEILAAAELEVRRILGDLPDNNAEVAILLRDVSMLLPAAPYRAIERIKRSIDALPDLPASAIDAIRDGIEAEGRRRFEAGLIERPWLVGEITGRTLEFREGRIQPRQKEDKAVIKNRFNAGEIDCVILNGAGATGIDLHASRRFKNKKRRIFFEVQQHMDPQKRSQSFGRVNRWDQVVGPIIQTQVLRMPAHERLIAMANAKLRRMSAATSSNRDNPFNVDDIADLMNVVGDRVCNEWAMAHPDIMQQMGFDVAKQMRAAEAEDRQVRNADAGPAVLPGMDENSAGNEPVKTLDSQDNDRSANEILSRIIMLAPELQEVIMDELRANFDATLQELESQGRNPLKSRTIHGIVHRRDRYILDGAESDDRDISEFHRPVYAQRVVIERFVQPIRSDKLQEEVERGQVAMAGDTMDIQAQKVSRFRDQYLRTLAGGKDPDKAIAEGNVLVLMSRDRIERLEETLPNLMPGAGIRVTFEGLGLDGVVTRIKTRNRKDSAKHATNEMMPNFYEVEFYLPGDAHPRMMSLEALFRDPAFNLSPGLNGPEYEELLRQFEEGTEASLRESRVILEGNDWRATEYALRNNLGSLVTYESIDGIRQKGILVKKKFEALDFLPVPMHSADMAAAAVIDAKAILYANPELDKDGKMRDGGNVKVTRTREGQARVTLPQLRSSKYGHIYDNPEFSAYVLERNINRRDDLKAPQLNLSAEELPVFMDHLANAGVRLYAAPAHRNWANDWLAQRGIHPEEAPAPEQENNRDDDLGLGARAAA